MKQINWSKWTSIAEIVSSFAIVITLIYLTIQTQQNTDAMRANSRDVLINSDLQIIQMVTEHPEINYNMRKAEITDLDSTNKCNFQS